MMRKLLRTPRTYFAENVDYNDRCPYSNYETTRRGGGGGRYYRRSRILEDQNGGEQDESSPTKNEYEIHTS